jgi:hypothetical protein
MIVALALGAMTNFGLFMIAKSIFTSQDSIDLLNSYGTNFDTAFVAVTLLLGLCFYPLTRKLKISRDSNT